MSDRIDYARGNLYGCLDCPRCSSRDRIPYITGGKVFIECPDCRLHEEASNARPAENGHMEVDDDG